ncbi:MAG TPA: hypothetical protein EYH45_07665 [Candidatus Caldiarchaeum subterraneum]|uniref:Uncharacterized protein n=1 Tax=Caldiarchaeum subterraneum TaxID=311458 RepID=A0A832ZZV5_CALS0|nr:hypothetical protein [Aigarchaeota archaeon]HIQ30421.1 hypothetical protein [Candidatus Caldarchaeum subterraneum]
MPARKRIKLEVTSDDGEKLTLILEGNVSRERILQLADLMELYSGGEYSSGLEKAGRAVNKLGRIVQVIEKHFPFTGFTTRDVAEAYRVEYREPIPLSTVSTYLSRLADRGFLERIGVGNIARYRVARYAQQMDEITRV